MSQDQFFFGSEFARLIPDKLYGRDKAKETLKNIFNEICAGDCKLALVPGRSGVGKTALVESFRESVEGRGGIFIRGKFDQFSHSTPYSAFKQALIELLSLFLQEIPSSQKKLKDEILSSLGSYSGVIIDFVPRFESLLGVQPKPQEVSSQEASHRFLYEFSKLFNAVCKPEQPLVLFLDDCQWSDAASMLVLKDMLLNKSHNNLLIIAAYRSDEVDNKHLFSQTLTDFKRISGRTHKISLGNLTSNEIKALVKDTFGTIEGFEALAKLLNESTGGNAIFVRELLVYLCEAGSIRQEKNQQWTFCIDREGQSQELPENIVDLYSAKLNWQRDSFKNTISTASCLGNTFDLELLSISTGRSAEDLSEEVKKAEALGLIYRENPKDLSQQVYRFRHDRIQQAAHNQIPQDDLSEVHLKIGRLLLNVLSGEALEQNLFNIVHHLNQGASLIDAIEDKIQLIELNLNAARKARQSVAYRAMLDYHQSAISLVDENLSRVLWENHSSLGLRLYTERAESEFLEGSKSEAEHSLLFAEEKAEALLDKADILNELIIVYTLTAKYQDAVGTARKALTLLGHILPEDDFEAIRDEKIDLIRDFLSRQNHDYLQTLPTMTDPKVKMATKIMITMGPPCYRSHQRLWGVIVAKVVALVLKYGDIPQVGYSHTAFAGLLIWSRKDFELAKKFGEAAIQIMSTKFTDPSAQSVFHLMVGSSYRHWFRPLKHSSQDYVNAYDVGVRSGNLQYAAYGFGHNMYCSFFMGLNLKELISATKNSLEFSKTRRNQWAIDLFEGGLHLFSELSEAPAGQKTKNDFEQSYLKAIKSRNNIQVRCIYHVIKAFTLMLMNENEEALLESDQAAEIIYTVGTQGLLPWSEHTFTRFMILSALYSDAEKQQKSKWRPEMDVIVETLTQWASYCPENYQHKLLLAKAEMALADGMYDEAAKYYVDAAQNAAQNDFTQWQALANERASQLFESMGLSRLSVFYWQQAYIFYKKWGAIHKVHRLQSQFMSLVQQEQMGNGRGANNATIDTSFLTEQAFAVVDHQLIAEEKEKLRAEINEKNIALTKALENLQKEVSSRKQSEKRAYLNELRMHLAIDSAKMGVWSYDLTKNKRYFDDTSCHFLGIDPVKFTGQAKEFFAAVHPEDHETIKRELKSAVEDGIPYNVEYRSVHSNGEIVYLKNHGKVVQDDSGNPEHLYGVLMDVSAQVLAQKEREELIARLKEKAEEQERFVYTVSHDLKSPLVTISGFAGIVELDLLSGNQEDAKEHLSEISNITQRMRRLLDDLLEISRVGAKKNPQEIVNLNKLISEATDNLSGVINEHKTTINVEADLPDIMVDKQRFLQVFENLIVNAIRYSSEAKGGSIVKIGVIRGDGELTCYVKDNGIGIEPAYLGKIFGLFERLDTGTSGTGVGLAIVKRIVETHGGCIWAESEGLGHGTTLFFTLSEAKL